MKRKFILLMAVASLGVFGCEAQTQPSAPVVQAKADGKPKLKFDKLIYDFGTTQLVQTVSGTFSYENAGDGLLIISNVTAGCGCTVPTIKPANKQLQPGEKGEIGFTLTLGATRGAFEKHITVKSNDLTTPQVNLSLRGTVAVVFDVPVQTVFGELLPGQSTNITVTVKRLDGQPLKLTKVESSDPNVTATFDPSTDPTNRTANVCVTVKAAGAPRQIFSQVSYFAEGHQFAVARTMVYGQVINEFRVVPEQIFWGITDPKNWPGPRNSAQTSSRPVKLELKKKDMQFAIKSAKTDIKDMEVNVMMEQTGRVYQVVAKLLKAPETSLKGAITVETDLPERPIITIPVSINVLSRVPVSLPVQQPASGK